MNKPNSDEVKTGDTTHDQSEQLTIIQMELYRVSAIVGAARSLVQEMGCEYSDELMRLLFILEDCDERLYSAAGKVGDISLSY